MTDEDKKRIAEYMTWEEDNFFEGYRTLDGHAINYDLCFQFPGQLQGQIRFSRGRGPLNRDQGDHSWRLNFFSNFVRVIFRIKGRP